jgi:hypothetical protein
MNLVQTASTSVSDFGGLDLEDLFADCYYDVPGLNSLENPITTASLQQQQDYNQGESIPQTGVADPQQQPPAPVASVPPPPPPVSSSSKKRSSADMDLDEHYDYDDDNDGTQS